MKSKGIKFRTLKLITSFSLIMTVLSVNQTCMYWIYQPSIPESAKKYRKF